MNNYDKNIGLLRGVIFIQPLNFLCNFFSVNLWKVNFEFFYFSYIAMMLRWFLYFRTALKTWSLLLSKLGLRFSYFGIFKIFTIFEKNSFSSSAVLDSLLINSPFSWRWIVTIYWIIRWKRVNNFPKFFLICYVLLIEISIVIYFSFSQKRSTFISLLSISEKICFRFILQIFIF